MYVVCCAAFPVETSHCSLPYIFNSSNVITNMSQEEIKPTCLPFSLPLVPKYKAEETIFFFLIYLRTLGDARNVRWGLSGYFVHHSYSNDVCLQNGGLLHPADAVTDISPPEYQL